MRTKRLGSEGKPVAYIYDLDTINQSTFPTPDAFPMQFGVGVIDEDWTSRAHIHKPVVRQVEGTAEFILILAGRLDATFYDAAHDEVGRETLTANMALLQVTGGHELHFHKGTKYLEIKQGPYKGREWDKYDL